MMAPRTLSHVQLTHGLRCRTEKVQYGLLQSILPILRSWGRRECVRGRAEGGIAHDNIVLAGTMTSVRMVGDGHAQRTPHPYFVPSLCRWGQRGRRQSKGRRRTL